MNEILPLNVRMLSNSVNFWGGDNQSLLPVVQQSIENCLNFFYVILKIYDKNLFLVKLM